jgi:hypothetical protein
MLKKTNLLGLLSLAVLGLVSFPAQAEPATSSTTTNQEVYIDGQNNKVQQRSHQVNIQVDTPDIYVNPPGGGSGENSAQQTSGNGHGNSAWSNRNANPGKTEHRPSLEQ